MKRVATAVVLIPLVLLLVFRAPDWLFVAVLGAVALACTFEYLRVCEKLAPTPHWITLGGVSVLFLLLFLDSYFENALIQGTASLVLIGLLTLVMPVLLLSWALLRGGGVSAVTGSSLALTGFLYVCVPFTSLIAIREIPFLGIYFLLILLVAVWSGDIAALYVGKLIGRHKLAPTVSPGKTWEGSIASLLFAIAVTCFLTQYLGPKIYGRIFILTLSPTSATTYRISAPHFWVPIFVAALLNSAAQLGDLAESMLKRAAGVKDSGNLLPGHGGMLDRLDALLFAAPIGMLIFAFTKQQFQVFSPYF